MDSSSTEHLDTLIARARELVMSEPARREGEERRSILFALAYSCSLAEAIVAASLAVEGGIGTAR